MRYGEREYDSTIASICRRWSEKINSARDSKRKIFQETADLCMGFYNGPKSWDEISGRPDDIVSPQFKISVNKAFELVELFGPALYFNNPVRSVRPRKSVEIPPQFFPIPDLAMFQTMSQEEFIRSQRDGIRCELVEAYLNWTPDEYDLNVESRQAIVEALVKGRGCLWTELHSPPGASFRSVKTSFESVDDLLVDPDARSFRDAKWIARRCVHPVWEVEKQYGLRRGSLKGTFESNEMQSYVTNDTSGDSLYNRATGVTSDLLVYYKVWSKMGIGGRLSGVDESQVEPLEMFGDYVYLAIAPGVPFPLNLSPELQANQDWEQTKQNFAWPIPYWADESWPVSVLDFHPVANCAWPMSHLKSALGELRFLNWVVSFIAGRLRFTTRSFFGMRKSLGEDLKNAILSGEDLTLLEIEEENASIADVVQILQHPNMPGDIWDAIGMIERMFDKRTGLTELLYGLGGSTQIRSAEEASLRNQNASVRPDDMAKMVEHWQRSVAAKEAIACRYHLRGEDVFPVMGNMASLVWNDLVSTPDIIVASKQLQYSIESGSIQRPNKNFQMQQTDEAMTTLLPVFNQYASMTGDVTPMNNLLGDWAKSRQLDPSRYQLLPPPPPSPDVPPSQGESSGGGSNPPPTEAP